jgi:hypothetical protein
MDAEPDGRGGRQECVSVPWVEFSHGWYYVAGPGNDRQRMLYEEGGGEPDVPSVESGDVTPLVQVVRRVALLMGGGNP